MSSWAASRIGKRCGIAWRCWKSSGAERTPDRFRAPHAGVDGGVCQRGRGARLQVIIAGAGGAAHLPGHDRRADLAAGARRAGGIARAEGLDSLLSIVQMPAGVAVGTLAIGVAGAKNAALLAASIVGLYDAKIRAAVETFRGARRRRCSRRDWNDREETRLPGADNRRDGRRAARPHVCHRGAPDGLSRAYFFAGRERRRASSRIARRSRLTTTRGGTNSRARWTCSRSSLRTSRCRPSSGRAGLLRRRGASAAHLPAPAAGEGIPARAGFPVAPFRRVGTRAG